MPNAQMNFRIDAELKRRGDERFARLGITPSDAMRRLYECAARYDDESESLLQSLVGSEQASPSCFGFSGIAPSPARGTRDSSRAFADAH